jgi:3-hydroxybutyryl-CoA dehydrogenase
MGSGIAESAAAAGFQVVLREVDDVAIERASARIGASLTKAIEGGKLATQDAADLRGRLTFTTSIADLASAEIVIEAVPEDLLLKREVLAAVSAAVSPQAILATNTSSLPIAELAPAVAGPERFLGLHFFSPVPVMALLEIVVALDTSPETVTAARSFAAGLGKTAIESKDRAGFIVNMLLVPYLLAAIRMLQDGFASAQDIDAGMRLGCGHPMGPLTLCDFIGLDVILAVAESLQREFATAEYAAPPLLRRMVASGRLGRKSGRGFYVYGA